ncbi:hypothetical protein SAMN05216464_10820 [Mucilaginibacter pineti]|uniref:Uncharacterized protein n=1 Tax=Mucilaginibacter pineti TaxID=1391627 RepID=A0A1G7EGW3_9SPHI|nr:hypothetical protein [Mucilaginibacter pineti]SDE62888.1 hypothetical protein SAMN05216464_10820 [Mucilaginibacter pineti]
MVPYSVEIELGNKMCALLVEQLQNFADVDGFCRYDVTAGERRSIIYVNVEYEDPQPLQTVADVENYYELIHYIGQPRQAYPETDDELFTTSELNTIAAAIRQYNREAGIRFPEFNFDL